jgi:hypothetical protein
MEPYNSENPPDSPGFCYDGDGDRYRVQYLAKLLQYSPIAKCLAAYSTVAIEWRGAARYRRQLAAAIEERRTFFNLAMTDLQARIEIVIRDLRSGHSVPLPNVSRDDGLIAFKTDFTQPVL